MIESNLYIIKEYLMSLNVPINVVNSINGDLFERVLVKKLSSVNLSADKQDLNLKNGKPSSHQAHLDLSISLKKFFDIKNNKSKKIYIDLISNNLEHLKCIDDPIEGEEFEKRNSKYIPKIRSSYNRCVYSEFMYVFGKAEIHIGRVETNNPQLEVRTPNEQDEFYKLRKLLYKNDIIIFFKYRNIEDRYLILGIPNEEFNEKDTILLKNGNNEYLLNKSENMNAKSKRQFYNIKYNGKIINETALKMTETPYAIVEHYINNNNVSFMELKEIFKDCKCGNKELILEKSKENTVSRSSDYFRTSIRSNLITNGIEFGVNTQWHGNGPKENFKTFTKNVLNLGYEVEPSDYIGIDEFDVVSNAINKIYFGAPGTGKSKYVDSIYYNEYSKRVTFHPEYTYNDFVGYIRPVVDGEDLIYLFVPGIFTEILIESLVDPYNMYTLIIEELNRANTAAVFGDLFQLLDRDDDGTSEYRINNTEIYNCIRESMGDEYKYDDGSIYIPSNLNIIATMNTADQSVFVMDTAFKRRWQFEYIPIFFDENHEFKYKLINNLDITWETFVNVINEFMMSEENEDLVISEDKQIGPYFVKENELNDPNKFGYKVLLYLWEDVFKMDKYKLFNKDIRTFSMLMSRFSSIDAINVFNSDFIDKLEVAKLEMNKLEEEEEHEGSI